MCDRCYEYRGDMLPLAAYPPLLHSERFCHRAWD
nr:MAG TPA: hypothetical protein [Caudoviricetes sp.]